MTLDQLQTYMVGVLTGWITNKPTLDKFSESFDGKLLYNGTEVGSGSDSVSDAEIYQAIRDTLEKLGQIPAEVSTLEEFQAELASGTPKIQLTKAFSISDDVVLSSETPVEITTNGIVDAFEVTGTLTLGKNITVVSDDSILYAKGGTINIDGAVLVAATPTNALGFIDAGGTVNVNSGKVMGITYSPVTLSVANGILNVNGGYIGSGASSAICAKSKGVVNINGGTVETNNKAMSAAYSKSNGVINVTGGKLINNGSTGDSATLIAAVDGIVNMSGGSVDNGVLAHESANAKATISGNAKVNGGIGAKHDATLVVTGGIFTTDPSDYVQEGYAAQETSGGVWTVSKTA